MFKRPTILCRRSSEGEHEFVVAMPEGSPADAVDRFAAGMGISSFRRLSGNRIAFVIGPGPVLTKLVQRSFSGRIAGYPVVRALHQPGSFPDEKAQCELSEAAPLGKTAARRSPDVLGRPPVRGRLRLGPAIAVGIAFLMGMAACALLDGPGPMDVEADHDIPATCEEAPGNVAVDLGTLISARGPTAVFRTDEGSLRYAIAGGSLEGRLSPNTEICVESGVQPALFTAVRELRDADGAFVFRQSPAMGNPPELDRYESSLQDVIGDVIAGSPVWDTAQDSTRAFYSLRAGWREIGSAPIKLEGILETVDEAIILRVGPVEILLVGLDDVDHLNLSMAATGTGRICAFGTIVQESPWDELRFNPHHPAFSLNVDWIEPETAALLCQREAGTVPEKWRQ
ncbi:MAG: hypothetical protein KAW17_09295 [Candidatus Eisenbacteria sp.]|nr:hypothetical protein [Candidatus Eisenbacteria bacterium]